MKFSDFVRTYCADLDFYVSDPKPRRLDGVDFVPGAGHFYFRVSNDAAALDGWYSMGSGLREYREGAWRFPRPSLAALLEALTLDARLGYSTFEDFCSDLGENPDSRRAYATWERCVEVHDTLTAIFGQAFDVLWECEEDE